MNGSKWIRQFHRWLALAFTAVVVANFVAFGLGQPVEWLYLLPLLPLALLLLTGLYLFVLPYLVRRRSGQPSGGRV